MTAIPRNIPLDGTRGLALLVVVIHNTAWISGASDQFALKLYRAFAAAGWVGVQLFFVLSGLLITRILLDTRDSARYFRRFYLRRALRIFPLYYAMIAAAVFVAAPLAWDAEWASTMHRHQWAFWLYLSNWTEPLAGGVPGLSHLWSLAVEEQFYLVWPALVWWLAPRHLWWLTIGIVIVAPFVRYALLDHGLPPLAAYSFTIARMDALAIGSLLALALRDDRKRAQMHRSLPAITLAGVAMLVVLVARQRGFHPDEVPVLIYGQSVAALLCCCLIAWTQYPQSSAGTRSVAVLSNATLRHVGKYSYAMYLVHVPLHMVLQPTMSPVVQGNNGVWRLLGLIMYTLLILALSYAAARLTWAFIEAPAMRMKERWAPAPEGQHVAPIDHPENLPTPGHAPSL